MNRELQIHPSVFVARGVQLSGPITIGQDSSVWYNTVLRATGGPITIGARTNVQDSCVFHTEETLPITVGDGVTIGHSAIIHCCTIEDRVIVGMGAIVMDETVVGHDSIIGAGALVTKGTIIPPYSLVLGSPAKVKRQLTADEIASISENADVYLKFAEEEQERMQWPLPWRTPQAEQVMAAGKETAEKIAARFRPAAQADGEMPAQEEEMKEFQPVKEGKVREIYDNGDSLIMVATDRISAFDHILKNDVKDKGKILTQMSKFWFDYTKDLIPNDLISIDVADMPEYFRKPEFEGRSTMCRKLEMLPVECIVRGYITGSGWASYQQDGTVCGIQLPEGLRESEKLPEPIYTPSTKAEIGDHDENISYEQSIDYLEARYPGKGKEYARKLQLASLILYKKCADYALSRGIIIADTKFEFGLDENGTLVLGDEVLTPDSSRFWPLEGYEPGKSQPSYDKQFVRDWLKANPDSDYLLPQEVIDKTIDKYKEAFEKLTGKPFEA